jgi:hypothetical protein
MKISIPMENRSRFLFLGVLLLSGCGFLSNSYLFVGEGMLKGRLIVEGEPAANALIFVLGEPDGMVFSDAEGRFSLVTSAGENKSLVVLWGSGFGIRKKFDLANEGDQNLGDLRLAHTGILDGRVVTAIPSEAEVSVAGTPFVARPFHDGSYRIFLPSGDWNLEFSAPGYLQEQAHNVSTSADGQRALGDLTLLQDPGYTCTGSEPRIERYSQGGGGAIDLLLLIDNSGSMVSKQKVLAENFWKIAEGLQETGIDFHIAVITPGISSPLCPFCEEPITASCINETGEGGHFQDRLGKIIGTPADDPSNWNFLTDPTCKVATHDNLSCLYDPADERGIVLVGTSGCGIERGLASMRKALSPELLSKDNIGFLRNKAKLAVIAFTDEGDCGEVGDISESTTLGGVACYYATKGSDQNGNTVDPNGKPYQLEPVEEYRKLLLGLKNGSEGLVTFSAIVGVTDPEHPETTPIEFQQAGSRWDVKDVCSLPGCTGNFCGAKPGTRYIQLAELLHGTIDTICQEDFSGSVLKVAGITTGIQQHFKLSRLPQSSIAVKVNKESIAEGEGWVWNAPAQRIEFDDSHVPQKYSTIEVSYETACP